MPTAMAKASKPNIVVIMSDDQDARLGSLQARPFVRQVLASEGITLENHFATVAQCCLSRTSWMRGQSSHNTNLTHVGPPGGAYEKVVYSKQDEYYLPRWLKVSGYETTYIGKFMNGINVATYKPGRKGWDHTNILVHPYQYSYNNVVMSQNGKRLSSTTVIIKPMSSKPKQSLTKSDKPFYIQIAPTSPHTSKNGLSVPCARHMWAFNNATAPRTPNFNPEDKWTTMKPAWLKERKFMTLEQIAFLLKKKGELDNTYFIYTTDNGFHSGQHRQLGGKGLPYLKETNIPMIIRGPGIPKGSSSKIPSTHVDMAPTFLEMASLGKDEKGYPPFFDERSLISEWKDSDTSYSSEKEVLNVEFWGTISNGATPVYEIRSGVYAYKTPRIISETSSWLFSRWCTNNETELYDTAADAYELNNLAINPTAENKRTIQRLNGLLLVTKSCSQESCRNHWKILQKNSGGKFTTLKEAMDAKYDKFFASLPSGGYQKCMNYQATENEGRYYPPESISLASQYRGTTDNFPFTNVANFTRVPGNAGREGAMIHRHVNMTTIMKAAREVTDKEMGDVKICRPEDCKPSGPISTDSIFNSCCPSGE
ncbi:putative arylsulfatase precursor [Fusarium austroafricanum]|uniref:Putative arylsulfatase n=1 Tax=Fusarium austroafricanum TaxID=2364996 RepID=A0A8H4KMT4_9HYPO|nr:putative arylsulfatase precursor [Fusarium austroafricanum]